MQSTQKQSKKNYLSYEDLLPVSVYAKVKNLKVVETGWAAGPSFLVGKINRFPSPVSIETAFEWLEQYRHLYRRAHLEFDNGEILYLNPNSLFHYKESAKALPAPSSQASLLSEDSDEALEQSEEESTIVDFDTYKQNDKNYTMYMENLDELLEETKDELYIIAINLAANGVWKKWNNAVSDYSSFEFTDEMLNNTGDSTVNSIMKVKDELDKLHACIKE